MILDNIKIGSWTRVVVLTGAGISAESGLQTFRDSDGLWENHRVEDVATPEGFATNPELVWNFYRQRYHSALVAKPNAGHLALAEMERKIGENFSIITQNVDGLHRRAGNNNVYEMHGRVDRCFCTLCKKKFPITDIDLSGSLPYCPKCDGLLRPDIVWFGEIPYFLDVIEKLIRKCNLFLVIGTSGTVYPAAGFVMAAKYNGAKTIGVNLEKPKNQDHFDFFYEGKSGDLLPGLVKHWLEFFDIEQTL
jgi:NAD-dependent deacetylase